MEHDIASDELYQETLSKIGRNVLYIQKIEAMMKILVSRANLQGTYSELESISAQKISAVSLKTMGQVTGDFVNTIYSQGDNTEEISGHITEPHFSMSFKVICDETYQQERKQALSELVKMRNHLIHDMVARLKPNSAQSCNKFCAELDTQYDQIKPEFETMQSLVRVMKDSRATFNGFLPNHSVIAELEGLRMSDYFKVTEEGASDEDLEELKRQLGYNLPSLYLSFLEETNGAEGGIHDVGGDCLALWKAKEVPELSEDYLQHWLPDCVLIGSDSGGRGIVFDRTTSDNPDHWTVYRVDFGDLDRDEMVWVADSFLEWAYSEFRLPNDR